MRTELKVLQDVMDISSSTKKREILESNVNNKHLADLLDAALNFKRKFFIKKFDMPSASTDSSQVDLHNRFMNLLNDLQSRTVTGHDAKHLVESFFGLCEEFEQTWYKRILLKDLKAGFTSSTANKAGFDIPKFDCMLAKADKDCKKLDKMILTGGWWSPKFDGYRCIAEIVDGHCTLMSRNGTIYHNFPEVVEELESLFPKGKHMLDGEIMSDSFMAMQSSAFVKNKETVGDMVFNVFDMVPWDEWESKVFTTRASQRFTELENFFENVQCEHVDVVKHKWVDSMEDVYNLRDTWIAKGFEGVMFLPDIPYYLGKKSNKMLKFKQMETMDVEIVDFYEGDEDTKLEGSLGGFYVLQEDGKTCKVGSLRGVSHDDRQAIWDNRDAYVGRVFEAEYQEIGSKGLMRFPIFIRWRDDKTNV
jgi:DNA ligase-1